MLPKTLSRLESIDQFRGSAILLMVLANYLAGIQSIPAWLKHAPDIGLTITDLVAPFFIFAIGLTFGLSWQKRAQRVGNFTATQHFVTRFFALIGIGAILSAGEIWLKIDGATVNWGVLQAIGTAGLLTLAVIRLSNGSRFVIGLALLAAYQGLLHSFWLADVLQSPHGGMPGAISWAAMLILSTVCADIFHNPSSRKYFLLVCLLVLAVGLIAAFWFPISKNRVSSSYALVSLGASGIVFAAFDWFKIRLPVLSAWGKNPLTLYILHLLILGLMVLPDMPVWYSTAPTGLIALQLAGLIGVLSLVGLWLERKSVILVL